MTHPPQPTHPQPSADGEQGLDLSAVRSRREPAPQAEAAPGQGAGALPDNAVEVPALVFDANEETFNDVILLSKDVPVVVDLWAEWCGPCKQLSPVLDRVVADLGGRVVLAKVDVDANPRIQQMFQVQSIPTVVAIIQGQPVPLFQGAQPEPQVRQVFDQLLQAAAQSGMTKIAVPAGQAAPEPAPAHPEALAALEAGDLETAAEVYRRALAEAPADADAAVGLARVGLLRRTRDLDAQAVRERAAAEPRSVEAALDCADLDLAGGHVDDAFSRLLTVLTTSAGEEREAVRVRLLELFEVVGSTDPRVVKARARLMRALF
ncbi:tetratricopeptide repeat protein [Brevibacterium ihuae]|uniref:tetratricopeptide repeat protein n=1 Tax=Brevibacterium ihuae TaxID=1631743 RepID=UPI001FE3D680|nr:tetratricopeptide repeat protein [Brevibacterium ihuae]